MRNLLSCQALISTPRSDGLVHRLIALPLLLPSKRGGETEAVARLLRRRLDIHGATRCSLRSGDAPRLLAAIGLVSAGALVTQTHSEQPSGAPPLHAKKKRRTTGLCSCLLAQDGITVASDIPEDSNTTPFQGYLC